METHHAFGNKIKQSDAFGSGIFGCPTDLALNLLFFIKEINRKIILAWRG